MTNVNQPTVKTEMLIKKPVEMVFEAFVNPEVTTKFWFTKSSGRLESGRRVRWDWEMYGVWDEVYVKEIDLNSRILIESSDGTHVEWTFRKYQENETFVTITNFGFSGNIDEIVNLCMDSMGGYTMVLCGLKAYLEHDVQLNLVSDRAPDAHIHK